MRRSRNLLAIFTVAVTALAGAVVLAGPAEASSVTHTSSAHSDSWRMGGSSTPTLRGTTTVTTAPGIAVTLLRSGVLPLPTHPARLMFGSLRGLTVKYAFPIVGGNPDLAAGTGDINHSGGINFVSFRGKQLQIGNFDIDLAAGKLFATQVNFAPNRIPVFDLDLSGLKVSTARDGATVLTGIVLRLDPAAAGALNGTFGLKLPVDGSLVFGSASVTLAG